MKFFFQWGCWMLLLGLLAAPAARGQYAIYDVVYRPARVTYRVLESQHFDLIYQQGAEAEARETAAILEATLPSTRRLVGLDEGRRLHVPVVLNAFNDRSNGFVTPFPFKQEIERTGIKGNILDTRFSSWLAVVGPHELAHAAHAEVNAGPGVGWAVRLVAPDWARALNLTAPPGLTEGLAVYRESRVEEGAGRLHAPLFTMKFRAAMAEDPWSLAQMLERPRYTRPYNRFYIGGAHFFEALAGEGRAPFFERSARLYNRVPFLGYGVALWYGTGTRPDRLGRQFRRTMHARAEALTEALGPLTEPTLVAGEKGLEHRRPRWLDNRTLVAYVQGYHTRPGFYRIDAETGHRTPISYQTITEDNYYSFDRDSTALYFARYVPDPLVLIQALADVHRLDLETGQVERLTDGSRLLAPVPAPGGGLWALQNEGPFNQWVHVGASGSTDPVTHFARGRFQLIAPSPDGKTVAVLLNVRGHQGLFRATFEDGKSPTLAPWILFEDASIYDADWSADGRYLLFAADPGGISNAYAYDTQQERLLKLTNVPYGALEPSLSPDGQTLAFINYRHERYDLVRMPFAPEEAEEVPRPRLAAGQELPWRHWLHTGFEVDNGADGLAASEGKTAVFTRPAEANTRPYRAWRYLTPRMVYPVLKYDAEESDSGVDPYLGLGAGLAVEGADPLQRWTYRAEAFYQAGRPWGEASVQTGRYVLRPSLALYDRPFSASATVIDSSGAAIGTRRTGVEERGVELGLRAPLILQSNVFQTYLSVFLGSELRQTRLIDDSADPQTPFRSRITFNPAMLFAYRLQANPRDLVPNTGVTLGVSAEVDAWAENTTHSRAVRSELSVYLPFLRQHSIGLRLGAGLLYQNRGLYDPDSFLPRGYEGEGLGTGTFARLDLEYTQPLWYIDDGFTLVPLYFKALYAYGFAQTLRPLDAAFSRRRSSVGFGLGLQTRFFYLFDLNLRLAAAYRLEDGRLEWSAR